MTKLRTTIRLRGLRRVTLSFKTRVWLDEKFLNLKKSLQVKPISQKGFDWGNIDEGAQQFALCVCMELFPPQVAMQVFRHFATEFIAQIQEDGFDVKLDLRGFYERYMSELMAEWVVDADRT